MYRMTTEQRKILSRIISSGKKKVDSEDVHLGETLRILYREGWTDLKGNITDKAYDQILKSERDPKIIENVVLGWKEKK